MKGDKPIKYKDLKVKLSQIQGVNETTWHITPMDKGFYTLNLKSNELERRVFARGTMHLKPRVFCISQWVQNFNLNFQN